MIPAPGGKWSLGRVVEEQQVGERGFVDEEKEGETPARFSAV